MNAEPLVAHHDGVRLAGSLWHPERKARALVLMYPGSGPSDRDNDVLFPPIRAALLDAGAAVCSFDKRGVGGSSGDWLDADIPLQAADLAAGLAAAREVVGDLPTGLFGHSQGGWVVLEAAAQDAVGFVITNSGPAVGPREQETYSTAQTLRLARLARPRGAGGAPHLHAGDGPARAAVRHRVAARPGPSPDRRARRRRRLRPRRSRPVGLRRTRDAPRSAGRPPHDGRPAARAVRRR
ncbi:alpha/beta hydrolase [Microbacterium elymi]|uniref:Alpha/beta fold hydrolase n=1 Tax=Microbacterium elymi TaxID=2909587 RepID=A0ABY5NIT2_9MICO|nr:alpha/beta fold hydrolase [Microbacterium elymi]UUT35006.1 alpha/beta fold hydrolase [Microbacterium elymi]